MNHNVIDRIKRDIKKSGFPLEIEVSSKLLQHGWGELIHDYYIDEEEGKIRETDVTAFRRIDIDCPDYGFFHVSLLIECKKRSEKPWVFFTRTKGRESKVPQFMVHSLGDPRIHKDLLSQERWMRQSHYFSPAFTKYAAIGYEPFTEENERKTIFESSMKVIKALAYILKQQYKVLRFVKNPLFIFYPVIVLDGQLFEYTFKDEVEPAMYLQYLVRHRFTDRKTDELVGDMFLIDVLRKEFLSEYLKMLSEELDAVKNVLISWTD